MNDNDKKINENFIKCQTKQTFRTGLCPFHGCQFVEPKRLTFNLKRHMKTCDFSPGKVQYRQRIQQVNQIIDVTPVNVFDNISINMNSKNSWGCAYPNKIVSWLEHFNKMDSTKNKNIVNLVLKNIIAERRIQESLKMVDNTIHIYNGDKWINNTDVEFNDTITELKNLWYKKIKHILQDNIMLWPDRIELMQKVGNDIGLSWLYTEEHCHRVIDEVLNDQFSIPRGTIEE